MKKLYALLGCLLLTVLLVLPVEAAATPLQAFSYRIEEDTVVLEEYRSPEPNVTVEQTYTVDGKSYRVVLDASSVFRKKTHLRQVTLRGDIGFTDQTMANLFSGCTGLRQVRFSGLDTGEITSMRAMFNECAALERIEGYENWDTGSLESIAFLFNKVQSLESIDLSRWDLSGLKNSSWCFQFCNAEKILLPDNLAIISAGFLNHALKYEGDTFTVPAGVRKIGYAHTFYDFATNDLTRILVAEGNTHYKSLDGILYSADGTEFLAVPRNKDFPQGRYAIAEGVTFLGELSFSRNYNLKTLILPDSLELSYVPLNDPAYITYQDTGNLNAGLNLNIAVYCYTGITAYEVHDSNPRYAFRDGVIYSKDMGAVEAVPTRYDRYLDIPEGVTQWKPYAMWNAGDLVDGLMANCPGVSIPASLTDIAPDQLHKLNRLAKGYGFTIDLAEDNPAYYLENGTLVARPRVADAVVQLEETVFSYDGQAKEPAVTVTLEGRKLQEGTDYEVRYRNNTDAGTATVCLTGIGGYFGVQEVSFLIEQAEPNCTPPKELTATYGQNLSEILLPEDFFWQTDTSVGNVGENRFLVDYRSPDPNYRGKTGIPVTVTVEPREVTASFSDLKGWYAFTGKPITPGASLAGVPEEEYEISYDRNLWFGKATVTLTDCPGGNYTVTGQATFLILPSPWVAAPLLLVPLLLLLRKRKR